MIYREERNCWEVEKLSENPKKSGEEEGTEYTFKVLKIIQANPCFKQPNVGGVEGYSDTSKSCHECKHFILKLWFLTDGDGNRSLGYCEPATSADGTYFHITHKSEPCEHWEEKMRIGKHD